MADKRIESVKISDITLDAPWYPRTGWMIEYVRSLKEMIEAGIDLEPIVLTPDLRLVEGLHRVHAYRDAGKESIPAEIRTGTEDEYWMWAFTLNMDPARGAALTLDDKRSYFDKVWKHHLKKEKWAREKLARFFGVSGRTIMRWVDQIETPRVVVRPSSAPRASQESPRPASTIARIPVGVSSASVAAPVSRPLPESLVKNAFDGVRVAITYARDDDVTAEALAEMADSLEDTAKSLFLTSMREGFTKIVEGMGIFYKKLRRKPPWE